MAQTKTRGTVDFSGGSLERWAVDVIDKEGIHSQTIYDREDTARAWAAHLESCGMAPVVSKA